VTAPDLLALLQLQQFADSAFPIGAAAHSFGLESLVDSGFVGIDNLERFLSGYLAEAGALEASYCERGCELARVSGSADEWLALNHEFGSRKPARESRDASAAMGRRFLQLAARMRLDVPSEGHLAPSFGYVAGMLGIAPEFAAAAYLQQSMTTLLSCCQRLLPLGQTRAQEMLWNLRPAIVSAAESGSVHCFTPLVDIASARHPMLHTRLFIS
jgi:urease accessory protein